VKRRGYTLIELVIVIALTAVILAFMVMFITVPVDAYTAQSRRGGLVDAADSALRFISRDVRTSLPNSLRTTSSGSLVALELLATLDGARYQSATTGNPALDLDFTQADNAFATTSPFSQLTLPFSSTNSYLSIYNVGVPGASAYEMANVITPAGTSISISAGASAGSDQVNLSPAFQFAWGSPGQRVYLVSGPVTFLCDLGAGTLSRYAGYSIASNQSTRLNPADLLAAGASVSLVAAQVSGCAVDYVPGTPERGGLLSYTLSLANAGDQVTLLNQVHVASVP
jgi:MSHA biogenesis protein MshO